MDLAIHDLPYEGRSYFAAGRACDVLKVSEAMEKTIENIKHGSHCTENM